MAKEALGVEEIPLLSGFSNCGSEFYLRWWGRLEKGLTFGRLGFRNSFWSCWVGNTCKGMSDRQLDMRLEMSVYKYSLFL